MTDRLKLMAMDEQDLAVIAALVQDSLTTCGEMLYDENVGQFSVKMRRYVWEAERKWRIFARRERRVAILHFNQVLGVRSRNLDGGNAEKILCLLDVRKNKKEVELCFADDIRIVLAVGDVEAQLSDQTGSWKAKVKPRHKYRQI